MSIKTNFTIEGLRELDAGLATLPMATARNVVKRVMVKAGEPVAADASARAHRLTGTLAGSATSGTKLTKRQASTEKEDKSKYFAQTYIGFGGLVQAITEEFGTSSVTPNPALRPAWDAGAKGVLDSIADDMGKEIEKAAKRIAKKAARAR